MGDSPWSAAWSVCAERDGQSSVSGNTRCCTLIPRAEASALRAQGDGDGVNHRHVQQRVFRSAHRVRPSFRSTTVTPRRSCAASLRHEPPSETGCDRARRRSVTRSVRTATPGRVRLHPAGWPAAVYRRRSCTCCGGGRAWHRSRRRCANEAARCRSDTEGDRRRSLVTVTVHTTDGARCRRSRATPGCRLWNAFGSRAGPPGQVLTTTLGRVHWIHHGTAPSA